MQLENSERYEQHLKSLLDSNVAKDAAWKEGFKKGFKEGYEQGRMEEKRRVARHLTRFRELSDEQISSVTGLSLTAIQQLREQIEPTFTPRLPANQATAKPKPFKARTFDLGEDVVHDRDELYAGRGL